MSVETILVLSVFTLIGLKYLADMVRFAMGEEINGKRRKPMFVIEKRDCNKREFSVK